MDYKDFLSLSNGVIVLLIGFVTFFIKNFFADQKKLGNDVEDLKKSNAELCNIIKNQEKIIEQIKDNDRELKGELKLISHQAIEIKKSHDYLINIVQNHEKIINSLLEIIQKQDISDIKNQIGLILSESKSEMAVIRAEIKANFKRQEMFELLKRIELVLIGKTPEEVHVGLRKVIGDVVNQITPA